MPKKNQDKKVFSIFYIIKISPSYCKFLLLSFKELNNFIFIETQMNYSLLQFVLPSYQELNSMKKKDRINYYRHFFALSRYNRLIIQFFMIKNAVDDESNSMIVDLQQQNFILFNKTVQYFKKSKYYVEFLEAITEEEDALIRIIEVYFNNIKQNFC